MAGHHIMFPASKKSLDFLSSIYLHHYRYWKDERKDFDGKTSYMDLYTYNCTDTRNTYNIWTEIRAAVRSPGVGLWSQYRQQILSQDALLTIMTRGVKKSTRTYGKYKMQLERQKATILKDLAAIVGHSLNPDSPKQCKDFFYEELLLPKQRHPQRKNVTTDVEALTKLKGIEPRCSFVVDLILSYRSLSTLLGTNINIQFRADDRWTTSYDPCGTETFRLASRSDAYYCGLNLQNITSGD